MLKHICSILDLCINWGNYLQIDQNRKSDIMWEFPIIQSETMWSQQEIPVRRLNQLCTTKLGNLSKKVKSIMYNRIGKKNRMAVASARVATWVSVAKVILGFSVHLPPLSEAVQTKLKTSSVSTAGNSYCWHVILTFFHYIIITLHITLLMVSFFTVSCSRLVVL